MPCLSLIKSPIWAAFLLEEGMTGHHHVTRTEFDAVFQDIKRLERKQNHEHTAWNRRLDRIAETLAQMRSEMQQFRTLKTWATGAAAAAGTAIAYAIISILHQGLHL